MVRLKSKLKRGQDTPGTCCGTWCACISKRRRWPDDVPRSIGRSKTSDRVRHRSLDLRVGANQKGQTGQTHESHENIIKNNGKHMKSKSPFLRFLTLQIASIHWPIACNPINSFQFAESFTAHVVLYTKLLGLELESPWCSIPQFHPGHPSIANFFEGNHFRYFGLTVKFDVLIHRVSHEKHAAHLPYRLSIDTM